MWESSRIMLPEHVELLVQQKEDRKKVPKPIIDEQAFAEIGIVIMDALRHELEIQITTWKDGHFINHKGIVDRVDYQMKYILLLQDNDEFEHITISDIVAAERL